FLLIYFSTNIFAEEKSAETNELGIKKGTMVYGEDISELSKEELQYMPKGWRDGEIESTHAKEEDVTQYSLMRKTYPDVNTYINKNNLSISKLKRDFNPDFEKFDYRYGNGAVEGTVAHETANNSSTI